MASSDTIGELGRIWKQSCYNLRYYPSICLQEHRTSRNLILAVALYLCESWSLALHGKCNRLRVFENSMLKWILGSKREETTEEQQYCIMKSSVICTLQHYKDDKINEDEMSGACCTRGKDKTHIHNFVEKTWKKDYLQDTQADGKIILKWNLKKWYERV